MSVGIVVAHFNTRRLIAQLVFSLYRLLGHDEFSELVVVDNGSNDGSRELLAALQRAKLIHLIQNEEQRYHGPALTQGVSWLIGARADIDWILVLDSDVVVLRGDTLREALARARELDAAAIGQKLRDDTYNRLLKHNREMLDPCCLIFDPDRIWRSPIPPFLEDGAPATALQVAADANGLRLVDFPFVEGEYVVHLGRGTLREIAQSGDAANRYFEWALEHRNPHFGGHTRGSLLYREFCELFDAEVGELTADSLVRSCLSGTSRSDRRSR